jgi:surface polysaccharide O-acyltransferase-like enzyme
MEEPKVQYSKPQETFFWADRLRNIATVMVIAIHVAAPVAHVPTDIHSFWWWVGNFWNSTSRPGVPLFVMLSGFLLLGKDYPLTIFLKKRFSKVVVPALFWMCVYSFYGYLGKGSPATVGEVLRNIVISPVHYHLWFIYLIIGLYLVYPVLRPWVKTADERDFLYFFTMCMIGTWCYKILALFFNLQIGVYFELFSNNCGYFVLGYYLGTKGASGEGHVTDRIGAWHLSQRQLVLLGFGLVVLGTAGTAICSYVVNLGFVPGTQFNVFFYDYLTPNVGISAMGWFLMVRFGLNKSVLLDIEKEFAAASFGIYFAHVLVMDWWGQCGYWHSGQHPFKGIPVLIGLVVAMTFMFVTLLRCMPGGKRIT